MRWPVRPAHDKLCRQPLDDHTVVLVVDLRRQPDEAEEQHNANSKANEQRPSGTHSPCRIREAAHQPCRDRKKADLLGPCQRKEAVTFVQSRL